MKTFEQQVYSLRNEVKDKVEVIHALLNELNGEIPKQTSPNTYTKLSLLR